MPSWWQYMRVCLGGGAGDVGGFDRFGGLSCCRGQHCVCVTVLGCVGCKVGYVVTHVIRVSAMIWTFWERFLQQCSAFSMVAAGSKLVSILWGIAIVKCCYIRASGKQKTACFKMAFIGAVECSVVKGRCSGFIDAVWVGIRIKQRFNDLDKPSRGAAVAGFQPFQVLGVVRAALLEQNRHRFKLIFICCPVQAVAAFGLRGTACTRKHNATEGMSGIARY